MIAVLDILCKAFGTLLHFIIIPAIGHVDINKTKKEKTLQSHSVYQVQSSV